jgi:enterochelin esterase family protein
MSAMTRWMAAAWLAAVMTTAVAAQESGVLSPRLRRLQEDVAVPRSAAVDEFWSERRTAGTPFIEPVDDAHVLVTFLWRGDAATKSVYVIAIDQVQFDNAAYLARGRMALLPGTDVWYRTYRMSCDLLFSYRFSVNDPGTSTAQTPPEELARRRSRLRADPLNPSHYESRSGDSSVAQLPCAAPQPDMRPRTGIPHGEVKSETVTGASGESHQVQIYIPPARREERLPLVISIGGEFAAEYPVPIILDNLIADGRIPPAMVVSILFDGMASYVKASRSSETFAHYVAKDLLPWLRARYPIAAGPRQIVISGASAPGAGAVFEAMRYPELFGNVITQGGGYWYPVTPAPDELIPSGHPETEPLARELASRPAMPFRVFLAVGVLDDVIWEGTDPRYGQATVLTAARHLRDVLEARGYDLTYREFGGGHEALVWRRTFAEGLVRLLGTNVIRSESRPSP